MVGAVAAAVEPIDPTGRFKILRFTSLPDGSVSVVVGIGYNAGLGLQIEEYTFKRSKEDLADLERLTTDLTPLLAAAMEVRHPADIRVGEAALFEQNKLAPIEFKITEREPYPGEENDPPTISLARAIGNFEAEIAPRVPVGQVQLAFKCPDPGPNLGADYVLYVAVADVDTLKDEAAFIAFAAGALREQFDELQDDAECFFIGARTRRVPALQAALDNFRRASFTV